MLRIWSATREPTQIERAVHRRTTTSTTDRRAAAAPPAQSGVSRSALVGAFGLAGENSARRAALTLIASVSGADAGGSEAPIEDAIADAADRAGAERDDEIAGPRDAGDGAREIVERRDHVHAGIGCRADRVGERVDRDPGDRLLAGGIDVGEHDFVGAARSAGRTPPSAGASSNSGAAGTRRRFGGRCRRAPLRGPRRFRSGDDRSRPPPSRRSLRRASESGARRR